MLFIKAACDPREHYLGRRDCEVDAMMLADAERVDAERVCQDRFVHDFAEQASV